MQNSFFATGLTCTVLFAAPIMGVTDTISDDVPNGYFAPLTVVEDHPQCSGPGQTAFEVAFETGSLSYEMQYVPTLRRAAVSPEGVIVSEEERCFVATRRGTERVEFEVNCSDGKTPQTSVLNHNVSQGDLSITGSFTACQSPFAFEVLESEWIAQIGGLEQTGSVFSIPHEGCNDAGPVSGPLLYLEYVKPTMSGNYSFARQRFPPDDLNVVAPAKPTFFRLLLDGMPLVLDENGVPLATAEAKVVLFPTDQGLGTCPGGHCSLSRFDLYVSDGRTPRQCR